MKKKIIGDTQCPSCKEKGADRTGNHLILFSDGSSYCNRCGYREKAETFTAPLRGIKGEKTDEEVANDILYVQENSVSQGIKHRGLKAFACKYYGVRTGLSCLDGITPVCFYYPRFSVDNKHDGYKVKTIEKEQWMKGRGKNAAFFGSNVIPKKGNKLFITEGEEDAVALYQTIYEFTDDKYKSRIAVVSLANGAGGADVEITRNMDIIRNFKEIVLCFDMDEAGRAAENLVTKVLPREKVKIARYALKDANEMVLAGLQKDLYFSVLAATSPKPEKIIEGCDITIDDLFKPLNKGISTGFPILDSKTRGMRYGDGGGELTVVCSGSGMGKTTLVKQIMHKMNKVDKLKLGHIFLEEKTTKTMQSYIALDNQVPLAELRVNPSIISKEAFTNSYNSLINNGRTYFMTHWGSLDSDALMENMWYLHAVGCNYILLDHLSLVVSGRDDGGNERKDIDILMTKLAAFVEESGTSVLAVVHLRRPDNGSFNDGRKIELRDLRGSAALEQLSHNVWAIEGSQHSDNPNERLIKILKSREWGDIGEADTCLYDQLTGILLPIDTRTGLTGV